MSKKYFDLVMQEIKTNLEVCKYECMNFLQIVCSGTSAKVHINVACCIAPVVQTTATQRNKTAFIFASTNPYCRAWSS